MATKKERIHRTIAFVFGLFECLVFAGCAYGWVALVFVLKEDGIYSHLCSDEVTVQVDVANENETNPQPPLVTTSSYNVSGILSNVTSPFVTCSEQDDMLMLAFTVGSSVLTAATFFIGMLFDKFGTRVTRIVSLILFSSGSLMLGFSSNNIPVLIFPGLCCFGVGGIMLLVTNMQIGNYFNVARLTVVTIYNASFDTSSSVLLLIKIAHGYGFKRLHCFIFLAVLNFIVVSISTFFLLPKMKVFPKQRQVVRPDDNKDKVTEELVKKDEEDNTLVVENIQLKDKMDENSENHNSSNDKVALNNDHEPATEVKGLFYYMFSRIFIIELIWHCVIQLRFFHYMGTLDPMITALTGTDKAKASSMTNVFSYILMCGIFFGPIEGLFLHLEKKRLHKPNPTYYDQIKPAALPQAFCSICCLILSILVLVPVVELLYVQFLLLTLFRAFLYGLNSAFIFMAFPVEYFGQLFGTLMSVNGLFGFLQYPLFKWAEGPPKDPTPPAVFLIVLVAVSLLQPISLLMGEKFDKLLHCCRRKSKDTKSTAEC